ncbi:MAG: CPBP family intramembrane glutamic endopeptidase [Rhizomicrobium sp.]
MAEASAAPVTRPDDPRVRWWEPLVVFVGGNATGTVLGIVAGLAAVLILSRKGAPVDMATLLYSFAAIMIALALNNLAMLGVTWGLAKRRLVRPFAHYFAPVGQGTLALAALSGVLMSVVLNGGDALLQRAGVVKFQDTPMEIAMVPHGVAQFAASVAVVSLLAPLAEEFLFRGLLMRWLEQVEGATLAITVSALVFGAVHGEIFLHTGAQGWLYSAELVVAGVVLALWARRTGTLRTSFACHAMYNLTATLFSVLLP